MMVDGRIPRLYVGAVEFDILHRFEHGPDEWPNILCAEVEAQATIDAADRELAGPLREVWALVGAEAVAHATAVIARLSVDDAKLFLGGVVLALRNGDLDVLARMAGPLTPRPDNGIAGEVHAGEVPY